MTTKDLSDFLVRIQPLARKLSEAMNRHEYEDAKVIADQLASVALALRVQAATRCQPEESYYG